MPRPIIHPEKSKDMQKCLQAAMDACPVEVFGKNDKDEISVLKPEDCIGCRACEVQCEEGAIVVED